MPGHERVEMREKNKLTSYTITMFNADQLRKIYEGEWRPPATYCFFISGPGGKSYLMPVIKIMAENNIPGVIVAPEKIKTKILSDLQGHVMTPTNSVGILLASKIVIDLSGEDDAAAKYFLRKTSLIDREIIYVEDEPGHAQKNYKVLKKIDPDNLTVLSYSDRSARNFQTNHKRFNGIKTIITGRPDFDIVSHLKKCSNHGNGKPHILLIGAVDGEATVKMIESTFDSTDPERYQINLSIHPRSNLKSNDLDEKFGGRLIIAQNGTSKRLLWNSNLAICTGESTIARMAGFLTIPTLRIIDDNSPPKRIAEDNTIPTNSNSLRSLIHGYTQDQTVVDFEKR